MTRRAAVVAVVAVALAAVTVWRVRSVAPAVPAPQPTTTTTITSSRAEPAAARKGLSLTDRAADKVKEISAAEALGKRLRVRVVGADGGFDYDLFYDDEVSPLDETFDAKGVTLVVDPLSLQYLDGTEIDFVEGRAGSGFELHNPNAAR